jgi:hypothetical protein
MRGEASLAARASGEDGQRCGRGMTSRIYPSTLRQTMEDQELHTYVIEVNDERREYRSSHELLAGATYTLSDETGQWMMKHRSSDEWKAVAAGRSGFAEPGPYLTRIV